MRLLQLANDNESGETCNEIEHLVVTDHPHRCLAPFAKDEQKQDSWGLVGLNHRTAPIELRSEVALQGDSCRKFLEKALENGLEECAVLSTCNRTEVYYSGGTVDSVRHALAAASEIPLATLRPHLYASGGLCGACHLVRVVAGLDSAVLGETEIVAQVKDAWQLAKSERATGPMLDLLFRKALEAGKRIRNQTELCRSATSLGFLAVRRVVEQLGDLSDKHIVVIGAGQIAERALKELPSVGSLAILNRTPENAGRLAKSVGLSTQVLSLTSLPDQLALADAVFCCATVDAPVVDAESLWQAHEQRDNRPLVIIDFGVPPNARVDHRPEWLTLLDVDHLRDMSALNEARKQAALGPALDIVEEELKRFSNELVKRSAAPVIGAISNHVQQIEKMNLDWASEKLGHLSDKDWQVVVQLAARLSRGVLERPIEHLKGNPPDETEKSLIKRLFGLEEKAL